MLRAYAAGSVPDSALKDTSAKAERIIAAAPSHCSGAICSSGKRIEALMIATKTSDIIKIPTRPGNRICEMMKINRTDGSKTNTEVKNAKANPAFKLSKSGVGYSNSASPSPRPTKVVTISCTEVMVSVGLPGHRFKLAAPTAQNTPDISEHRSPILIDPLKPWSVLSNKKHPSNPHRIARMRSAVTRSESQIIQIMVDQIGVR